MATTTLQIDDFTKEQVQECLVQAFNLACDVTKKLGPHEWNTNDPNSAEWNVWEQQTRFVDDLDEDDFWKGSREATVCQSILALALQTARQYIRDSDDAAVTEWLTAEARDYLKYVEKTLS